MRVKVNDGDWPVGSVDGPQQREGDGVVTPECDDARKRLALFCRTELLRIRLGSTRKDAIVALFDLVEGIRVVIPARVLH